MSIVKESKYKNVQKTIEDYSTNLKIKSKRTRKKQAIFSLAIIGLSGLFYLFTFIISGFLALFSLIAVFDGGYIAFIGIPRLIQPLSRTDYAFTKIVEAQKLIDSSSSEEARKEAAGCIKAAYKSLSNIQLVNNRWYDFPNKMLRKLIENMRILERETIEGRIQVGHLKSIASALASRRASSVKKVNETIADEDTYVLKPIPQLTDVYLKKIKRSKLGKIGYSLAIGYVVIIAICTVYILLTGQDFSEFMKLNPAIVIGGGLTLSGLTFWKT